MSTPTYPDVHVDLTLIHWNGSHLRAAVRGALRDAGVPADAQAEFMAATFDQSYENVLGTCVEWVTLSSSDESTRALIEAAR